MERDRFLLYGANGYTGQLIARYAHQYALEPILAGRNEKALKELAAQLNMTYRVINIDEPHAVREALQDVKVVIHAAGPFQFTAKEMVEACLDKKTHYLDINGDISVFEMVKQYDSAARKAGIMILPGAGFDVVPTDCTALLLKKMLPGAVQLHLAFATLGGGLSHGTATTMVNKLGEGGNIRKNGVITRVALGHRGFWVDFGKKKLFVMSIPWGDVSTAYFTTGIPNIETYTGISRKVYMMLKLQPVFNWLLRTSLVRKFVRKKIDSRPAGPTDQMRSSARSLIWGEVTDQEGSVATARFETPDGYTLTAHSSLLMAKKILQGDFIPGYQTPASAYGENLILEIPGVTRI